VVGAVTGHPTPQGKVGHPPYGLSLYAGSLLLRATFEERRKAEVQLPRLRLLGTWENSQTVNAREFSHSTCCTLQPFVERQCRGLSFGLESTAALLLPRPPRRRLVAVGFCAICR
jgi:hypothetical protein